MGRQYPLFARNVTKQPPTLFSAHESLTTDRYSNRSVRPKLIGLAANVRLNG
jgi:hypothetical protein